MIIGSIESLSVVIPTFNRLGQLRRTLGALSAQVGVDVPVEVVVIDDGSTDGTAGWLATPEVPVEVVAVSRANGGPAAARNCGIETATGDLVVFLDDDVVPATDLLVSHLRRHAESDGNLVVIGPMRTPAAVMSPWVRWEQKQLDKQYDAMIRGDWEATARQFYTGNASVARRHLTAAGGFDVSFRRAEDIELGQRLADAGLRFAFAPEAVVHHFAERSFRSWRDAATQYGTNDAVFALDHGHERLLDARLEEFRSRHVLVRTATRTTLRSRAAAAIALPAIELAARALCRTRLTRLTDAALSGLYNLRYYHGMAAHLGGGSALLARMETPSTG